MRYITDFSEYNRPESPTLDQATVYTHIKPLYQNQEPWGHSSMSDLTLSTRYLSVSSCITRDFVMSTRLWTSGLRRKKATQRKSKFYARATGYICGSHLVRKT